MFNNWLDNVIPNVPELATDIWNVIQEDPLEISPFRLSGDTITVRLAYDNHPRVNQITGVVSALAPRDLLIVGVYNHPRKDDDENPVPDTDLISGDRFVYDDDEFEVIDVTKTFGVLQARAWRAT